ncbi:MAG: ORF6N domain-containing protein [Bacteroidota bacterium]
MTKVENSIIIVDEVVMNKIYIVRGQKVMLDRDLAELYQIETKHLKRQVKRNIERFPDDFMIELTQEEVKASRYQFGTLKQGENIKYLPYAFTEQGVAMLSSVLNSTKAIQVNIQIIRIFTRIRQMLIDNTEIRLAIEKLEKKTDNNTKNIEVVFQYMDELTDKKELVKPRKQIGYKLPKNK